MDTPGVELSPRASTNPVLIDPLAEHRNADRDTIKRLTKVQLWQLIDSLEVAASEEDSMPTAT